MAEPVIIEFVPAPVVEVLFPDAVKGDPGEAGASGWDSISGKPSEFPPDDHTHAIADTTGLQDALDGKATASHTHAIADTIGLQTALDGKVGTGDGRLTDSRDPNAHAASHGPAGGDPLSILLSQISNASADGKSLISAADYAAMRALLGVGAAGQQTLFLKASEFIPRTTSGCGINSTESATNRINLDVLEFDATAIEHAQIDLAYPVGWVSGTITAKFHWSAASGSGDVVWGIQGVVLANDAVIDSAFGSAQTATDTLTAIGDLDISPATGSIVLGGSIAEGNHLIIQVYRNATSGSDTLSVDAQLIGVALTYTPS